MIPPFEASTGLLPSGVHEATWEEFVARFGWTPHRLALLAGLKAALDALEAAGCPRVYVDGSFVTAKPDPGDFDGCWEPAGVDVDVLDGNLLLAALAPVPVQRFQERYVGARKLVCLVQVLLATLEALFAEHGTPVTLHGGGIGRYELAGEHTLQLVLRGDPDKSPERCRNLA